MLVLYYFLNLRVFHKAFKVRKLSFFIHNSQDADDLDPERIEMCSFHCATSDGSVSMCLHNAKRDDFILPHVEPMSRNTGGERWQSTELGL